MSRPWYAFYVEAYRRATAHLSFVQDAAYRRMLDHYYDTEKPLPVELAALWRITGAAEKSEKAAVSSILAEFFHLKADGWHNDRADAEIAERERVIEEKRANGKSGGIAAKGKSGRKKNSTTIAGAISETIANVIAEPIADEWQKNTHLQTQLHSGSNEPENSSLRSESSDAAQSDMPIPEFLDRRPKAKTNRLNGHKPDFAAFYDIFPLHKAKRAAEKAYPAALKRAGSAEIILAGASRYRDDRSRDPLKTKHPATWLNGDCWLDETSTGPPKTGPVEQLVDEWRKEHEAAKSGNEL